MLIYIRYTYHRKRAYFFFVKIKKTNYASVITVVEMGGI